MSIVLYHHPFSRASNVVWMLEEVGAPYELRYVDIRAGAQKAPEILALNPMGKLPILTEGDVVVTEVAAIGLYLADRHAYGRLAPRVDDPREPRAPSSPPRPAFRVAPSSRRLRAAPAACR